MILMPERLGLKELESEGLKLPVQQDPDDQISFSDLGADEVRRALLEIDLNTLTPIEGMNLLFELQRKARA